MNIKEELLRIQYLVNYEKGKVISEQKTTTVTKQGVEGGTKTTETTTQSISIPYSQDVVYSTGSNTLTPESYKSFTEGILTSINSNPESKKMLEDKNIKLTNISVMGSASNSWGNKATGYDLENDRTTKNPKTPNDNGYRNNLNLAKQRADILLPQLTTYLKSIGVSVDDSVPKVTSSVVINTSGFTDNSPNRPANLRPGQFISVNLTFNYIKTDVKETVIPKKYDPKYIIQGSYFCNSKNGAGEFASNVTPLRCKDSGGKFQTPDTKNLGNYIAIYEIKYSQKLSTDLAKEKERFSTEVYPKIRWNFYWENGKINKISLEKNNKVFKENIKDSEGDLNELKKFMNLSKYSPDTGQYSKGNDSFESLVSNYLK
jgi:hypothetical protein